MKTTPLGIVLVDRDGRYRDAEGELPVRPAYDKPLLLEMVKNKRVLCSPNTARSLPLSIWDEAKSITTDVHSDDVDINLGISTFDSRPPETMVVVKSLSDLRSGPKFRLPGSYVLKSSVRMHTSSLYVWGLQ